MENGEREREEVAQKDEEHRKRMHEKGPQGPTRPISWRYIHPKTPMGEESEEEKVKKKGGTPYHTMKAKNLTSQLPSKKEGEKAENENSNQKFVQSGTETSKPIEKPPKRKHRWKLILRKKQQRAGKEG